MPISIASNGANHDYALKRLFGGRWVSLMGALVFVALFSTSAFAQWGGGPTKLTIKSTVMGEDRTILVRTPAGYEKTKTAYPVLYMTDGDAHIGHTSSTIEFLVKNGRMADMIVVGISNTDRTRDLTPTKATGANAGQFPTAGGADNFLKFIETEVIPEIEKNYRVQPYRVLAGHSFGGLFAVHAMITRPELFNSYVAVSPSLQWSDEATLKRAEEFLKTRKEFRATLFASLGNEPGAIGKAFDQFRQLLAKSQVKGFEWDAQQMADEDHGSVVLRSHYAGLRKVFDGWQMPRDPATGGVAGGLKAADVHYKWLSEKFHYSIPTPENLINQIGYQDLLGGNADEAIVTFKANVERFPNSANVYDSLAEAYEKNGHAELAAPLYEKAQMLGKQNNDPNLTVYSANFARASEKVKQWEASKQAGGTKPAAEGSKPTQAAKQGEAPKKGQ
ncbi:MAG TPA: alpha/beta hydrolase-fold protein [Pyrinomonadaceae bacterium]|nr:alpha/beta hydrolase-fold protein [Pyrinomonadaceae bacterium]